ATAGRGCRIAAPASIAAVLCAAIPRAEPAHARPGTMGFVRQRGGGGLALPGRAADVARAASGGRIAAVVLSRRGAVSCWISGSVAERLGAMGQLHSRACCTLDHPETRRRGVADVGIVGGGGSDLPAQLRSCRRWFQACPCAR